MVCSGTSTPIQVDPDRGLSGPVQSHDQGTEVPVGLAGEVRHPRPGDSRKPRRTVKDASLVDFDDVPARGKALHTIRDDEKRERSILTNRPNRPASPYLDFAAAGRRDGDGSPGRNKLGNQRDHCHEHGQNGRASPGTLQAQRHHRMTRGLRRYRKGFAPIISSPLLASARPASTCTPSPPARCSPGFRVWSRSAGTRAGSAARAGGCRPRGRRPCSWGPPSPQGCRRLRRSAWGPGPSSWSRDRSMAALRGDLRRGGRTARGQRGGALRLGGRTGRYGNRARRSSCRSGGMGVGPRRRRRVGANEATPVDFRPSPCKPP